MIGEVTPHMLPRLSAVPDLRVNGPLDVPVAIAVVVS